MLHPLVHPGTIADAGEGGSSGSCSFRSRCSLLKNMLLLSFRRFLGLNKYLCLTKGICLPPSPLWTRHYEKHITSGQECFCLSWKFSLCFSSASIAGTRDRKVPCLHLESRVSSRALSCPGCSYLGGIVAGIKRQNAPKAKVMFAPFEVHLQSATDIKMCCRCCSIICGFIWILKIRSEVKRRNVAGGQSVEELCTSRHGWSTVSRIHMSCDRVDGHVWSWMMWRGRDRGVVAGFSTSCRSPRSRAPSFQKGEGVGAFPRNGAVIRNISVKEFQHYIRCEANRFLEKWSIRRDLEIAILRRTARAKKTQHMTARGDTAWQPEWMGGWGLGGGQADGREGTARVWEHFVYVKSVMETGHQNITKPWKWGYFSSLT